MQASTIKIKTLAQVFFCIFAKFLGTPFPTEHHWWLLLFKNLYSLSANFVPNAAISVFSVVEKTDQKVWDKKVFGQIIFHDFCNHNLIVKRLKLNLRKTFICFPEGHMNVFIRSF